MALDVEQLLAPVSDDAPAGEDLSYEPERQEIEQAFESSVSGGMDGDAGGGEVDWRKIVGLIEKLSGRSKDICLAVYLTRAGARWGQLATVEAGAEMLAGLLERYWETVHPQLEELGFQGRKAPCDSLAHIGQFLRPLEGTILLDHGRFGRFSGVDFERFRTGGDAEEGYGQFRAALDDTSDDDLKAAVASLNNIAAAIKRADAVLTANGDAGSATNFQPTYEVLERLSKAAASYIRIPDPIAEEAAAEEEAAEGAPAAAGGGGGQRLSGKIETREDVLKALDALSDYYRRREPSNPVVLLLQRARDWVNMDFISILEDIAPAGLEEARRVLSSKRQTE